MWKLKSGLITVAIVGALTTVLTACPSGATTPIVAINVSPKFGLTVEEGKTADFTVQLVGSEGKPSKKVVLDLKESSPALSLSATQLTFTPSNWNTAQKVTVTSPANSISSDSSVPITLSVNDAQSDDKYDELQDIRIEVELKNTGATTPQPGGQAEAVDESLFERINSVTASYKKNEIWKGYDSYATVSQYLIYVTGGEKDAKAARAFLINPKTTVSGATKLDQSESKGLDVYRYDGKMQEALEQLQKGNGAYDFDFVIDGQKYYLQLYRDGDAEGHEDVALTTHENFHAFQFANWDFVPGALQDEANYPITKELLSLQMLSLDTLLNLPDTALTKEKATDLLQQYVAIRSQEIALDPSSKKLVKNMANPQEQAEGSARYVEVMGLRDGLKSNTTFVYPFSAHDELTITSKAALREAFAFGIWYETGAAATYLLDRLEVDIEKEFAAGKTPYDVAVATLKMSQADKDAALKKAQAGSNWSAIQAEADAFIKLK